MWRLRLVRRDNQKVVKERRLLSAVYGQPALQHADEPGVSGGDNPAGAAEWTQQPVDKYEFMRTRAPWARMRVLSDMAFLRT